MTERILHELIDAFPKLLLPAVKVTIPLTLLSFSLGLLIALMTALVQVAKVPVLRKAARFYVWIIRCTPMIVQLFVVYFGLPSVGIRLASFPSAVLVFFVIFFAAFVMSNVIVPCGWTSREQEMKRETKRSGHNSFMNLRICGLQIVSVCIIVNYKLRLDITLLKSRC